MKRLFVLSLALFCFTGCEATGKLVGTAATLPIRIIKAGAQGIGHNESGQDQKAAQRALDHHGDATGLNHSGP